jgi:hypothetical protein
MPDGRVLTGSDPGITGHAKIMSVRDMKLTTRFTKYTKGIHAEEDG